jgi:hypothetical protein
MTSANTADEVSVDHVIFLQFPVKPSVLLHKRPIRTTKSQDDKAKNI